MLDGLRNRIASGLSIVAQRVARDNRYPSALRVSSGLRTMAGVVITPDTAVTISAVWACLRYLSQTVAVLPWHVMRDGDKGAEIQKRHPIDWLLYKRPNPEWSSFQFRETLTHWALRWGNGYAEIEPDQLDRPYALWPIHPERVLVCRSETDGYSTRGDLIPAGELYYEVNNGTAAQVAISAKRMFHIRGFGEGPVGVNVISYASQSLGWARAAQLFGATYFGNGMNAAGIVTLKNKIDVPGFKRLKEELNDLYKGVRNSHKTAILEKDATWQSISTNPQSSQLIETHQYLVEEVCRWFGVPPHKIAHLLHATFTNIEKQGVEVVTDSISPWVTRFEDEADYKLFGQNRTGLYTKMNMRALMRGDPASRSIYYKNMWALGAYSPNRILELEDENTIGKAGDLHVVQKQYVSLEQIANPPKPPKQVAPPAPPSDPNAPPANLIFDAADEDRVASLEAELCPTE